MANRPDDCPEAEGALRVDARFSRGDRIVASLKPAPDRLVTVDCVLILARRYVDLAGDSFEKLLDTCLIQWSWVGTSSVLTTDCPSV